MSVLVNLEIPVKEERLEEFFDFLQNTVITFIKDQTL